MNDYIYIGFSEPKGFKLGAAAIKMWQRSDYSHVYLRTSTMVIHSAHGSVHAVSLFKFRRENNVVCEFKVPVSDLYAIQLHCYSVVGQKYGYMELFKIFSYDILNTIGIKLGFNNSDGFICSEFIGWVLTAKLNVSFDKPNFLLTPKDIYLKLEECGYGKTI